MHNSNLKKKNPYWLILYVYMTQVIKSSEEGGNDSLRFNCKVFFHLVTNGGGSAHGGGAIAGLLVLGSSRK